MLSKIFKKLLLKFSLIIILTLFNVSFSFAANWYVDNAATGANNGTSWASAWKSFALINWTSINAGDTIYISGGSASKTYNEKLEVGKSGITNNYITIKPGSASPSPSGHSGNVIITNPVNASCNVYATCVGIVMNSTKWVDINGDYNGTKNIIIANNHGTGIQLGNDIQHVVLEYLDIYNNGDADSHQYDGINITNLSAGLNISEYPHVEIRNCLIHNNSHDQIHLTGEWGQAAYDRVLIHDNEFYDIQDDGVEAGPRGVSYYNNIMHGIGCTKKYPYPDTDGISTFGGYAKIYNNSHYNFYQVGTCDSRTPPNSYFQPGFVNFTQTTDCCLRVYNNLAYHDRTETAPYYLRGIEVGGIVGKIITYSDILIANNTIVGIPFVGLIYAQVNKTPLATTFSDVYVVNNIIHNSGYLANIAVLIGGGCYPSGKNSDCTYTVKSYTEDANVRFDYNIISAGASGRDGVSHHGIMYSSYTNWKSGLGSNAQGNITNANATLNPMLDANYKPTTESPVINIGVNLLNYFDKDKGSIYRPAPPANWNIGAYEYLSEVAPNPPFLKAP